MNMDELYMYGETLEGVITKWDPRQLGHSIELPYFADAFYGLADWADYHLLYLLEEQRAHLWKHVVKHVGGGLYGARSGSISNDSGGGGTLQWRQLLQPVADVDAAAWGNPHRPWTVNLKFDLLPAGPEALMAGVGGRGPHPHPHTRTHPYTHPNPNPNLRIKRKDVVLLTNDPAVMDGECYDGRAVLALGVVRGMPNAGETYCSWGARGQRAPYDIAVYAPYGSALAEALKPDTRNSWFIAYVGSMAPYNRMYYYLRSWRLDPTARPTPMMALLLGFVPPQAAVPAGGEWDGDEELDAAWTAAVEMAEFALEECGHLPQHDGAAYAAAAAAAAVGAAPAAATSARHDDEQHQRRLFYAVMTAVRSYCKDVLRLPAQQAVLRAALAQAGLSGLLADEQLLSPDLPPPPTADVDSAASGADAGGWSQAAAAGSAAAVRQDVPRSGGTAGFDGEGLLPLPFADLTAAMSCSSPSCTDGGSGSGGGGVEILLVRGPPLPKNRNVGPGGGGGVRPQAGMPPPDGRTAAIAGLLSVLSGLSPPGRAVIAAAHSNVRVAQLARGFLTQLQRPGLQLAGSGMLQRAGVRPMGPPLKTGDCIALFATDAGAPSADIEELDLSARVKRLFDALHGAEGWYGTVLQLLQLLSASEEQLRAWSGYSSGSGCSSGRRAAAEGGGGHVGEYVKAQLQRLIQRMKQQMAVLLADLPSAALMGVPSSASAITIVGAAGGGAAEGVGHQMMWTATADAPWGGDGSEWGLALLDALLRSGEAVEWELGLLSADQVQEALLPLPRETGGGGGVGGGGGGQPLPPLLAAMRRLLSSLEACRGLLPNCRLRISYQDQNRSNLITALSAIWGPEGWMHVVPELLSLVQLPYQHQHLSRHPHQHEHEERGAVLCDRLLSLLRRLSELAKALESAVPQSAWVGPVPSAAAAAGSPETSRAGRALLEQLSSACEDAANILPLLDDAAARLALSQAQQQQQQLQRARQPVLLRGRGGGGSGGPASSDDGHEGGGNGGGSGSGGCGGDLLAEAFCSQLVRVVAVLGRLEGQLDLRGVMSEDALTMFCLDHARLLFSTVSGLGKDDLRRTHLAVDCCLVDGATQVRDVELTPLLAMGMGTGAGAGARVVQPAGGGGGSGGAAAVAAAAGPSPRLLVLVGDPPEPRAAEWGPWGRPQALSDMARQRGYGCWSVFDLLEWRGWPAWELAPANAGGGGRVGGTTAGGGGGGGGGVSLAAATVGREERRVTDSLASSHVGAGAGEGSASWSPPPSLSSLSSSLSSLSSWPTVAMAAAASQRAAAATTLTAAAKAAATANAAAAISPPQQGSGRPVGPKTWAAAAAGSTAARATTGDRVPAAARAAAAAAPSSSSSWAAVSSSFASSAHRQQPQQTGSRNAVWAR